MEADLDFTRSVSCSDTSHTGAAGRDTGRPGGARGIMHCNFITYTPVHGSCSTSHKHSCYDLGINCLLLPRCAGDSLSPLSDGFSTLAVLFLSESNVLICRRLTLCNGGCETNGHPSYQDGIVLGVIPTMAGIRAMVSILMKTLVVRKTMKKVLPRQRPRARRQRCL